MQDEMYDMDDQELLRDTGQKMFLMFRNMRVWVTFGIPSGYYRSTDNSDRRMRLNLSDQPRFVVQNPGEAGWRIITDLVHEMAHWLIASRVNRRKDNYGLDNREDEDFGQSQEWKAKLATDYLIDRFHLEGIIAWHQADLDEHLPPSLTKAREWWKKAGKAKIEELVNKLLERRTPT